MRVATAGSVTGLIVLAAFLVRPISLSDFDSKVGDWMSKRAGPGTESGHVVIVEIDEKSLQQYGRWPWPRDLIGRLAQDVLADGASTVAFDMMFAETNGGNDRALADAIANKPSVIGYALQFDQPEAAEAHCTGAPVKLALLTRGQTGSVPLFHATGVTCGVPVISSSASAAGFLNAAADHDGVMRHVLTLIEYHQRYYPSLALAAVDADRRVTSAQMSVGSQGGWRLRMDGHTVPLESEGALRLRFRGPKQHFPHISAADILSGQGPLNEVRGRIALIGGSAAGMEEAVVTPASPRFPAVEIQATAMDNLLQGDAFYRPDSAKFWELALAMLACFASTRLLSRSRFVWGAIATLVLAAAVWAGCILLLSKSNVLLSPLAAMIALAVQLPVLTFVQYLNEKKRADLTHQQLIDALQHSKEVLQASEYRYRRLVENVNDAIIMDDLQGRIIFANRRFREWFGVPEGETINLILESYVAPEWRVEMRDRHDRRMRGEMMTDHFEFEGVRSDGTRIWIEALVTIVEDEGAIIGSQAALRDITERKRIEAQYLQAQKMESIGRLAGGVAHDFNNLLTVINGYSGMLLARMEPDEQIRQDIEEIHKAGERAADLTQKLLVFSRKQMVRPRPLSLNSLVTDARKMFERLIGEDVELKTNLTPDLEQVVADPSQIHQVLMNLVVNARDAMPNGGTITIETRNVAAGDHVRQVYLGVSDTGTGMADDVKQHLFEPFFTTKDQGKGTGLGLATVYGIVNQSGGRIDVRSVLGHGSTFQIYLPGIQPDVVEAAGPADGPSILRGSETVLVVEDQDAVRQFARVTLESFGYQVLQTSNGPDAINLAQRYPSTIHLLITDIILPMMDGRVLADRLRAVRPDTKVLYISGYTEEAIGRGRALDGDLPLLRKPFTSEVLATRVREILNGDDRQQRTASKA